MNKKFSSISMMKEVKEHFRRRDPALFAVLDAMDIRGLGRASAHSEYFARLCREIIGQQLGSKGAAAIVRRFEELLGGGKKITPKQVLALPEQALRDVGMSWAKARTVRALARHTAEGTIGFRKFHRAPDDAIIRELTHVKGIGPWTAEMFLIFTLGREDVFSVGDLGLRKGFMRLYGKKKNQLRTMEQISKSWAPYRSYACLALWHLADSVKK